MSYIVSTFGIVIALLILQVVAFSLIVVMYVNIREIQSDLACAGSRRCCKNRPPL
jgi:hypothetical protein